MEPQNDAASEPWEALDVDDSDLPFLRPCSTRRRDPQTLSPSPPPIPGPAGAVQAAMRRRAHSHGGDEEPVPTQEYIRRVLDRGGDGNGDGDFAANPWLCALEFLRTQGAVDGDCTVPGTPLSSIRNGIHKDRVTQVVAIIKSCTPTGLGDLMVTLKDPTGTLGASIHRKVLSEGQHGKNISIGAVLVLQKVAVFAPSRSSYYLNITSSNVVKVISKDSGPPLTQNHSSSTVGYADQGSESRKTTHMPQAIMSQVRTQGIMNNLRKSSEFSRSVCGSRVMEENSVPEKLSYENYKSPVANAEELLTKHGMTNGITKVAVRESNTSSNHVTSVDEQPNLSKPDEGDDPSCSIRSTNAVPIPEIEITKKPKLLPVARTSVPEWTDEQLDQLGAFDD